MNLEEIATELEIYYNDRITKIRKVNNILNSAINNDEELCCDTLIVMLYAQLEGYVNDLLLYYVEIINQEHLKYSDVKYSLCAAAKSSYFDSYENYLKNRQKYIGRLKLIKNLDNIWDEEIFIHDNVVDTKNNLKENIFIDLMNKLGFEKEIYSKHGSIIDEFVDYRNSVAHGNNSKHIITYVKYQKFENLIIEIMKDLKSQIKNAVAKKTFLKSKK